MQGRSVGLSFGCRNTQSQCRNTNAHTLPSTHISATPQTHTHCRNHKRTHTHVAATTHTHTHTHIAAATPHRYTHVTYNITHAQTNPRAHTRTHMRAHTHARVHTLSLCRHRTGPRGLRSEDFRISTTKFLSVVHACMHTKRMEGCKQELGEVAWSFEGKVHNHQR